MKLENFNLHLLIVGIALVFCVACSSSDDDNNPKVQTGQFIDAEVGGINYKTETQEGITNADGEFLYIAGETVVFSIGNINFPSVTAGKVLTPCDLAGTDDTSDTSVVNMARLLQTLDSDRNPANGITISAAAHTASLSLTITIEFDSANFDADVAGVVTNGGSVNIALIDAVDAIAHLDESIASISDDDIPNAPAIDYDLLNLEFTTAWLNGKTLYNVFYEEGNWLLAVFEFTDSTSYQSHMYDGSENNDGTYIITTEGYINITPPVGLEGPQYIRATGQTADHLTLIWSDILADLTNDMWEGTEYFFFDYNTANAFITSDPEPNYEIEASGSYTYSSPTLTMTWAVTSSLCNDPALGTETMNVTNLLSNQMTWADGSVWQTNSTSEVSIEKRWYIVDNEGTFIINFLPDGTVTYGSTSSNCD